MRLLFSAHDAGGGDALVPLIKALSEDSSSAILCILGGKSKEVFIRESIPFVDGEKLSDEELAKEINAFSPDAIITGTSFGLSVDKRVLCLALMQKIPTLSIIDYWSNYTVRFHNLSGVGNAEMLLPDKICVVDELMKTEMLLEGFPEDKILVTGNPRFDAFGNAPLPERVVPGKVLFVSQPFIELQEQNLGIGYTEMGALREVVEVLEKLSLEIGESPKKLTLIIRPHPRENQEKFAHFLSEKKISIQIDSQSSIQELLSSSEIILGMTSMVMFEAAMYQKKVLVYQPHVQKDLSILQKIGISKTITDKEALAVYLQEQLMDKMIESHNYINLIKKYTQNNSTEKVISAIKSLIKNPTGGIANK